MTKRFCTGSRTRVEDDLSHYSPGTRFVLFQVNGVRCGLQICHDFRYPETLPGVQAAGGPVDVSTPTTTVE